MDQAGRSLIPERLPGQDFVAVIHVGESAAAAASLEGIDDARNAGIDAQRRRNPQEQTMSKATTYTHIGFKALSTPTAARLPLSVLGYLAVSAAATTFALFFASVQAVA